MSHQPHKKSLVIKVLGPVCAGLLLIALAGFYAYQLQYQNSVDRYTEYRANSFGIEFQDEIDSDSGTLLAIHSLFADDTNLHAALARKDTEALYQLSVPIFNRLRETVDITHFYFTDVDRTNLLRVHAPTRSGDRIDRLTMLAAERAGEIAVGVDLGPLGTLTLRAVAPWFDESGIKIGYLELGIDVESILEDIARENDFGITLAIPKSALDRDLWTIGNKYFEGAAQWDRYENFVTGREHWLDQQQLKNLPDLDLLAIQDKPMEGKIANQARYYWSQAPIYDLNGMEIGKAILSIDITGLAQFTESLAIQISAIYALVTLALVGVIYSYIRRTVIAEAELNETIGQLEHLATFDHLTGLPNRYLFIKELEQRLRESSRFKYSVGLAFIDVDNFKIVNDTWGHRIGDDLLKAVAHRMSKVVRDYDVLARFGGDEFVLMMPQTDRDQAAIIATKLGDAFKQPVQLGEDTFPISLSIGVSVFPEDGETRDLLMQHADVAMYRAKEDGKNCYRVYSLEMKINRHDQEKSKAKLRLVT